MNASAPAVLNGDSHLYQEKEKHKACSHKFAKGGNLPAESRRLHREKAQQQKSREVCSLQAVTCVSVSLTNTSSADAAQRRAAPTGVSHRHVLSRSS